MPNTPEIKSGDSVWIVELDGKPIAKLVYQKMDWPWCQYEVIPLSDDKELISEVQRSFFYSENYERLKYRFIPTNEIAECNGMAMGANGKLLWFRGIYLKEPKQQEVKNDVLPMAIGLLVVISILLLIHYFGFLEVIVSAIILGTIATIGCQFYKHIRQNW